MGIKMVGAKPGAQAWVHFVSADPPDGLAERMPVFVVSKDPDDALNFIVRTRTCREFSGRHHDLDAGRKYNLPGLGWVHESDPSCLAYLVAQIRRLKSEVWQRPVERDRLATINDHEWVLARNTGAPTPPPLDVRE